MKKKLCVLCVLAMILSIISACGTTTEASTPATSASTEANEVAAPVVEDSIGEISPTAESSDAESSAIETAPVTINYPVGNGETYTIAVNADSDLLGYIPDSDPANCGAIAMMQKATGINLDYTVYAMLSDSMTLMIASGDWTDIICKVSENTTYTNQAALDEEVILDLAPYIEEYAPDYAAVVNSNETFLKQCFTDDGRMAEFHEFRQATAQGSVIRMDWLEEAGITKVPATFDELEAACLAVKNNHPDIPGCIPMAGDLISEPYESVFRYGYGFNGDFFLDENGDVQFAWTSDNGRAYLEMLARWVEERIVTVDEMLTADIQDMRYRVFLGQSLMQNGGSEQFSQTYLAMVEDENFELVPMGKMVINEGDELRVAAAETTVMTGWSISTTCKDPVTLIQALNWLYTEEGTIAMNFGTKDVSYTIDENGEYHFTDLILNNPDGCPLFFATSVYTGLDTPYYAMPEQTTAKLSSQAEIDAIAFWNAQPATNAGTLRGTLNSEETERAAGYADINTLVQERVLSFIMGDTALTDEAWNQFVNEVNSMGIDVVIECYQSAEDRYYDR